MDPQTSVAVALLLLLAYGTGVEARARHKVGLGFGVVVGLLLLAACTFYEASQVSELLPPQVCHPSRSPLVRVLVFVWSTPTRLPLDSLDSLSMRYTSMRCVLGVDVVYRRRHGI